MKQTLHPDVLKTFKEVTIKESEGFRLRIEKWNAVNPKDLICLNFVQESLNEEGEIWQTSTYNFHMTEDEIKRLAECIAL